ncbi:MAG TPA: WD40 repeat domain-containing protein [Thermoanaerobaculia bacterium]|jgi:WD40 repeat protein
MNRSAALAMFAIVTIAAVAAAPSSVPSAAPLVLSAHRGVVSSVAAAGDRIVSGGIDGTVRLWRAADGNELATLRAGGEVHAVAISPDGRAIVAGVAKQIVSFAQGESRPRWSRDLRGYASAVAFSPDGRTVAAISSDGTLTLLDAANGAPRQTIALQDSGGSVAWSRDGRWLAAGGVDVQLWQVGASAAPGEPRKLAGHHDLAFALAFSPDGTRLVSASLDRTARLWNVADGAVVATLETAHPTRLTIGGRPRAIPQQLAVTSAAWSPDGATFVTAGADRAVHVWDAATGKLRESREGHTRAITAVAFTPNGRIVSSSADGTVRIW